MTDEEKVGELHDYIAMSCDELIIVQYLIAQGDTETAQARLEGAIGQIESVLSVFVDGGLIRDILTAIYPPSLSMEAQIVRVFYCKLAAYGRFFPWCDMMFLFAGETWPLDLNKKAFA